MGYLVDAHALLWHRGGNPKLPPKVRDLLGTGEEAIFVSDATLWEITIKHSLGRLTLAGGVESLYQEWIGQQVARVLPVEWAHIQKIGMLPHLHGDPFDRMLVAQAIIEDLALITGDQNIGRYPGVEIVWE